MREIRQSGSEGGGTKSIASPYPYFSNVDSRCAGSTGMAEGRRQKQLVHFFLETGLLRGRERWRSTLRDGRVSASNSEGNSTLKVSYSTPATLPCE